MILVSLDILQHPVVIIILTVNKDPDCNMYNGCNV